MKILVLNGGSSSFKCWYSDLPDGPLPEETPKPLWTAHLDWNQGDSPAGLIDRAIESLWKGDKKVIDGPDEIDIVGHRIVHGGPNFRNSTPLTGEVRAAIAQQVEFAPSHNRFELEAIRAVDRVVGLDVRQIAVFDTGFHSTLEPSAYIYPGPYEWLEHGIRRYGFHGISHQYASRRAAALLNTGANSLKLIVCHIGSGASLAAIKAGKSVDTTMGFTPLEGLMMSTRSGSIDPGIPIYLIRHRGYKADELDRILNRESGLRGLSGLSGDMREILQAMDAYDQRAKLAFDVYAHRLVREVGGMLAVLGGVDGLVFTGGVGENCALLRERVCRQLEFLGLKLDAEKNAAPQPDRDISDGSSAVRVLVIHAEEEWQIARECHALNLSRPSGH